MGEEIKNNDMDIPEEIYALEEKIPGLVKAFETLQFEELLLFCRKNLDYGTKNITKGLDVSKEQDLWFILISIWTRMSDKVNRWQNLLVNNHNSQVKAETVLDTLQDISNYANIAQLIYRGQWKN